MKIPSFSGRFFLLFAKSTGVSLQDEASEGKHDGTKRTEISGWRGASVLPTVRQSHCAEPDGQAQEILLRHMPEAVVESPPDAGTLEVRAQSRVPGLREGIQGRQKTSDESPFRTHSFPNPGSTGEGKT